MSVSKGMNIPLKRILLFVFLFLCFIQKQSFSDGMDFVGLGGLGGGFKVDPTLSVKGPANVSYNEIFQVTVSLVFSDNGIGEILSSSEVLPRGFKVLKYSGLDKATNSHTITIQAPAYQSAIEFLEFHLKYRDVKGNIGEADNIQFNLFELHNQPTYYLTISNPLTKKYGVNPDTVNLDYNGNIGLAVAAETLPTWLPLGFFVLGEPWGERFPADSLSSSSGWPKVFETIAFVYGIQTEERGGERIIDSNKVLLCSAVYLGALLIYDLPNIFKYNDAKIEISKLKSEGKPL